jgi:hypothetical protein
MLFAFRQDIDAALCAPACRPATQSNAALEKAAHEASPVGVDVMLISLRAESTVDAIDELGVIGCILGLLPDSPGSRDQPRL